MYKNFFKTFLDIFLSMMALIILSPLFVVLIILGRIKMRGNPFFTQERPGKNEKLFKLIKFRSMTEDKDEKGNYLPDEIRLTKYGKFLRKTSLDELPEFINILKGDMSFVGPRPLLVKYLPLYNEEQHHRHDVRPGLTGLAQVHGRTNCTWKERFRLDVEYVNNISFIGDVKILIDTVRVVLSKKDVDNDEMGTMYVFTGNDED